MNAVFKELTCLLGFFLAIFVDALHPFLPILLDVLFAVDLHQLYSSATVFVTLYLLLFQLAYLVSVGLRHFLYLSIPLFLSLQKGCLSASSSKCKLVLKVAGEGGVELLELLRLMKCALHLTYTKCTCSL